MSKIPEQILQAGLSAYSAEFLSGTGSLGDGVEAAYFAIRDHDDWVRAGPAAWCGEGLPPVGTVCEHRDLVHGEEWTEVEIVAHRTFFGDDYPCAVFVYSQSSSHSSSGDHFRPLRTPEQIEAEARSKSVSDIIRVIGWIHGVPGAEDAAGRIYDAGFRKGAAK